MPEGDTVWLAGRRMHDALAGEVLTRSDFRVPHLAVADLSGLRVLEVASRGKHLLTRIEGGQSLHTHFRMDGSWHLYRTGEPWRGGPAWQVRVLLTTAAWQAVGYRLPVVELLPTSAEESVVGHLGPDLLGADWDAAEAVRRIGLAPERELGPALLDQRNLAGVGNLYKTETCFLAGLTPWTRVGDLGGDGGGGEAGGTGIAAVVDLAHRLLLANRGRALQVTTGDSRRGRWHWVFEREGRPCWRCGSRIRSAEQGDAPYQRLSYWCPVCQRGPAPQPSSRASRPAPPVGRTRYRP